MGALGADSPVVAEMQAAVRDMHQAGDLLASLKRADALSPEESALGHLYQVMKAIVRMLLPGREPAFMCNGMGRKGRRLEKGLDMRSAMELERDRGRRIVPLHT